jgi:DNA-binding transcriptional regulator YiaG
MKKWKPKDIVRLRKELQLSQTMLGERLGVSRMHVYYLERGVRKPSKTLCILLDCIERKEVKKDG